MEKIKAFAGTMFSISHDPAAEYSFIDTLIKILQRANWLWRGVGHISTLPLGDVGIDKSKLSAVQLRINSASIHLKEAAEALAGGLVEALEASVSVAADAGHSSNACAPDKIHIEIYRKP